MRRNMTVTPERVYVQADELVVVWSPDHTSHYDLVDLRLACMCAYCSQLRNDNEAVWPRPGAPAGLRVEGAELVGAWGLNLRWNDRHETGIYPWEWLLRMCRCEACGARRAR